MTDQRQAHAPATATEWLRMLYPGDPHGHLVLWTRQDRQSRWFSAINLEGAGEAAAQLARHHDVYAGVGLHPGQLGQGERGRGEGVCAVPGLWLDLDVAGPAHQGDDLPPDREAARRILDEFALPPTAIVDSGHGLQVWWLFSDLWKFASPEDHARAAELSRRFQATLCAIGRRHGWHVDVTADLARVLRVPGTMNRKLEPVAVGVVELHEDRRYRPEDFEPHLVAVEQVRGPAPPVEGEIPAQHRSTTLTSLAGSMRRRGMGKEAIAAALLVENEGRCNPPLPESEVRAIAASVASYTPGDPAATNGSRPHGDDAPPWEPPEEAEPEAARFFIVWPEFWARDRRDAEWLYEDVLAKGRGHSIYAGHKVGKSLLTLAMVVHLVTRGVVVIYLDYEMGEDDLYDRLADMGHGPDTDLSQLHYALLPSLPPLDEPSGAKALLAKVDDVAREHTGCHVAVVIDTTGRAVAGEENSADTYRNFYRWTGLGLKQRGVTWCRLDHAGKDAGKGQRGSSGKGDDVDVVWRLVRTDNGVELRREASRMGWVPERVTFRQTEDPLRFVRVAEDWPAGTSEVAGLLDELEVDPSAGARVAAKALRDGGLGRRYGLVVAGQRWRRRQAEEGRK